MLGPVLAAVGASLLDVLAPEVCALCDAVRRDGGAWAARGPCLAGARPWDAPHLCCECLDRWSGELHCGRVDRWPLISPRLADAALVDLVVTWKYRGVRGLGWPLARLLAPALAEAIGGAGIAAVVPVPLHRRRRRERGFDQVVQLATFAAPEIGAPIDTRLLRRIRPTGQQASLDADGDGRRANVAGAFACRPPRVDRPRPVILVDDLATTGATLAEAAAAVEKVGWRIAALVALGQAARLSASDGLDTADGRTQAVASRTPRDTRPQSLEER
jgi:predicted amidophosphoribosyltransferase